jgi:LysM repeat protein
VNTSNALRLVALIAGLCALAACQLWAAPETAATASPATPACAPCPACATAAPAATCAAVIIVTATPVPPATATASYPTRIPITYPPPAPGQPAITANDTVNVRSGPGSSFDILGQIAGGETVRAIGRTVDNTWWQIVYPGSSDGTGWVIGALVTPNAEAASVPVIASPPTPTPWPSRTPWPTPTSPPPIRYIVQPGDTLPDIALRFGVSVEAIKAANGMTDDILIVGQEILIPLPTPTPVASRFGCGLPEGFGTPYVVQAGDTWFGIAYGYGVDVELLLYANCIDIYHPNSLYIGQTLSIPPPWWTPVPWQAP